MKVSGGINNVQNLLKVNFSISPDAAGHDSGEIKTQQDHSRSKHNGFASQVNRKDARKEKPEKEKQQEQQEACMWR